MKLANKDHDIDGLDDFFFKKFDVGKKYSEFTKIIIVTDKLIFRNGFPKMKLYCNKTSRRTPFLVKELSKATCWQINFNLILLRLKMK